MFFCHKSPTCCSTSASYGIMIDASQRGCLFRCQRSVLTWSREQRTAVYFPTWAGWFSLFVLLIISETLSFTTSFLLCSMVYSEIWPLINFHSTFQEIALLSQFEHENIVHYFGTDKVSSPIFQLCITLLHCWSTVVLYTHRFLCAYFIWDW